MAGDIVLRDVIEEDLPIFYEQQRDPVATQMAAFPARAWEPFLSHWKKIIVDDTVLLRTVLFDGKVAGNIVSFEQSGEREVGYWIGRDYWGKGIATGALRQFLVMVRTRPLYAHVAKHNVASRRVLEKCGFALLREDKGFAMRPGAEVEEFILILRL